MQCGFERKAFVCISLSCQNSCFTLAKSKELFTKCSQDKQFNEFPARNIVPIPDDHSCKRTWEHACYHCRNVCRLAIGFQDNGDRSSFHNYVLERFRTALSLEPNDRSLLPDPADDSLTDTEWLGQAIHACLLLESRRVSVNHQLLCVGNSRSGTSMRKLGSNGMTRAGTRTHPTQLLDVPLEASRRCNKDDDYINCEKQMAAKNVQSVVANV